MKLIVGLGNPGKRYEKTRHNVGFLVLDALRDSLAQRNSFSEWQLSKKFNAYTCGGTVHGEKVILAKPLTFMNASGHAVQLIGHFYKMTAEHLLVVHDDKDLPLGEIKMQDNRGHAGHNGVKSIIQSIKSQAFWRVRLGIKSTNEKKMSNTSKFVLGKFGVFKKKTLKEMIVRAVVLIEEDL